MIGFEIPNGRMWREFDLPLLALMIALIGFGLITLFGATIHVPGHGGFARKQALWVAIGTASMFCVLFLNRDFFHKGAPYFYLFAIGLLVFVLTRHSIKGAHSWIRLGPLRIQPSEPAKIAVILMIARTMARMGPLRERRLWPGLLAVAVITVIPLGLVAIQPDLGTAAIFILVVMAMLWAGRIQRRAMAAILLWGVLIAIAGYPHLKPHQKRRITSFLNPESDPRGAGYHITQARIAQGSGRIFGKGFGKGEQTTYRFLPEYHNDFIFSSLGEQFGFAGCALAIALFVAFLARSYHLAEKAGDHFGAYVIVGLTTVVAAHVALNLGMSLGLLPVMGLPLPFFSYGGSFMLTNFLIVGIILNLRMRRYMF